MRSNISHTIEFSAVQFVVRAVSGGLVRRDARMATASPWCSAYKTRMAAPAPRDGEASTAVNVRVLYSGSALYIVLYCVGLNICRLYTHADCNCNCIVINM